MVDELVVQNKTSDQTARDLEVALSGLVCAPVVQAHHLDRLTIYRIAMYMLVVVA